MRIKYLARVIVAAAIAVLLLSWIVENFDQRGGIDTPEWGFWFFFAVAFSTAIGFTVAGLVERLVVLWTKSRHRHHRHHGPVLH